MQKMKMKLTLNCKGCGAPALETVVVQDMTATMGQITYTKTGGPKFGDKVLTKDIKCANCGGWVVKFGGFPSGLHASISMSTVQDPKSELDKKAVAS